MMGLEHKCPSLHYHAHERLVALCLLLSTQPSLLACAILSLWLGRYFSLFRALWRFCVDHWRVPGFGVLNRLLRSSLCWLLGSTAALKRRCPYAAHSLNVYIYLGRVIKMMHSQVCSVNKLGMLVPYTSHCGYNNRNESLSVVFSN